MSRKYKFHDNDKLYFISFAVVNWVDFFIREEYNQELINSWQYNIENKGLQIWMVYNDESYTHDSGK